MNSKRFGDEITQMRNIYPAEALIFIGSDLKKLGKFVQTIEPKLVRHVDPSENSSENPNPFDGISYEILPAVVSDSPKLQTYYRAAISRFSGLLRPESLRPYWKNLSTVQEYSVTTTTLDILLNKSGVQDRSGWLIIDDLPGGSILEGSRQILKSVDVVIIKVLSEPTRDNEIRQCTSDYIEEILLSCGFVRAQISPGNHPAFSDHIYARDWKSRHLKLRIEHEQTQERLERQREHSNALEFRLEEAQRVIQNNEQNLSLLRSAQEHKQTEMDGLRERSSALENKFDQANQTISELESKLKQATEQQEYLNQQLKKTQSEKAGLNDQIIRLTDLGMEGINSLQKRVDTLGSSLEVVSSSIDETRYLQLASLNKKPGQLSASMRMKADRSYRSGDFKRAAEYYQAILERRPKDAWAMQGLAESVARMEYDYDANWYNQDRALAIEESGKWDVTVRLYRKALQLDPDISAKFDNKFLPKEADLPSDGVPNPIFIVGCGHSGTSIMLRVLGNHPNLHAIPKETAVFLTADSTLKYRMHSWDKECFEAGHSRWIEKTPPHIFQISRFLSIRPKSQFVLMIRDGRDVVCSLKKRVGYSKVQDRIDRWVFDNKAGLRFWDHPQVKVVRYEDFVENPEQTTRDLFDFLGESHNNDALEYHRQTANWYSDKVRKPRSVRQHSDHMDLRNWQINQPVFDGRNKWKQELTRAEKTAFKKSSAQELLEQLGYVEGTDW